MKPLDVPYDMNDADFGYKMGELIGNYTIFANLDFNQYDIKYNSATQKYEG